MSLIKCPECNKEISDKSTICIHCGYPMSNSDIKITSNLNIESIYTNTKDVLDFNSKIKSLKTLREMYGLGLSDAKPILDELFVLHDERKTIENMERNKTISENKAKGILCCPKCGSTAVAIGQRGFSIWSGFLGSGKTVNRCGNCGYKWEPGK